jgi:hypothetical protein
MSASSFASGGRIAHAAVFGLHCFGSLVAGKRQERRCWVLILDREVVAGGLVEAQLAVKFVHIPGKVVCVMLWAGANPSGEEPFGGIRRNDKHSIKAIVVSANSDENSNGNVIHLGHRQLQLYVLIHVIVLGNDPGQGSDGHGSGGGGAHGGVLFLNERVARRRVGLFTYYGAVHVQGGRMRGRGCGLTGEFLPV